MDNYLFVLDIGSGATKLLAGYVIDGQPIVVDALKVAMPDQIRDGRLASVDTAAQAVKTLLAQMEKNLVTKITAVTLILPPFNLQVYTGRKTTNIISQQSIIAPMDIKNLNNLFRKESAGDEMVQVGIVPDSFILDDDNVYEQPPLGLVSNNISLDAHLHFIDKTIYLDYIEVCAKLGLKVRKTVVDLHGAGELLAALGPTADEYLLIDIGARITSVGFIAADRIYAATHFEGGAHDLTDAIAGQLGIPFEDALRLQEHYGYDERENVYDGVIYRSLGDPSANRDIHQSELNQAILPFMQNWLQQLANTPALVQKHVKAPIDFGALPWTIIGGARKLKGFRALYETLRGHQPYVWPTADVLGARDPNYLVALGGLYVTDKYSAMSDEVLIPVTNVQRIKGQPRKSQYNAFDDEL